ncbi:class I adenylate-forming enzyme family protein [uncultured Aquitalea sp.]|uniref:class I adenylate-forming enzyme family protein n=1 Tax=uncultured Aquitalea sp. TaxID=540272 RepID=UPI0025FC431A|nr:class I adenylate-forming enzyme family protein [uncultured Aquitalea sp.]
MNSPRYDFFAEVLLDKPQAVLLRHGERELTRGRFFEQSIRLLNHLVQMGARHGDRIVISLENRPEYLELVAALALGGMTACPVDPAISQAQLEKTREQVKASLTITSYDQLAYSLSDAVPDCVAQGGLDAPFLVVFSSGTTGAPKGIVQSVGNFFRAAAAFAAAVGMREGESTLHNWPMFYNAGLFNLFACPLMSGGSVVVGKRFAARDIGDFWQTLAERRPSYVYLSPTMASSVAKTSRFFKPDLTALQQARVITTSSILYPAIKDEFKRILGADLSPCFGITELGGSFTIGGPDAGAFSVGQVMPGVTVSIDAAADGELLVSTPFMALGYLVDGELKEPFDREQVFRTGDLGHLEGKELFISGRKKDSIKKGGELINLSEIEDLVHAADLCEECYAVGRPDLFWGETYDVFFIAPQGGSAEEVKAELLRLFNQALPQTQRPDRIEAVNSIPRTSSGKPIKRLISYQGVTAPQAGQ